MFLLIDYSNLSCREAQEEDEEEEEEEEGEEESKAEATPANSEVK